MQPINVDTQNARSRLWNGKEYNILENLSWLKGNHLVQFGGRLGHQHFFHRRDDKVVGGLTSEVFTIGRLSSGSHVNGIPFPVGFAGSASRWRTDYASILGIMERAQQLGIEGVYFHRIGIPDEYVHHGAQDVLRAQYDLHAEGIAKRVREFVGEAKRSTLGELSDMVIEAGNRIPLEDLRRMHERGVDSDHIDEVVYGIRRRTAK